MLLLLLPLLVMASVVGVKKKRDESTETEKRTKSNIAAILKTMGENKMDMDIAQVDQAIEGNVSVGWFQSKEDLHAEAVRLQEAGRYQEALVAFFNYRNALGKEGNDEETVETADMYSDMGQAYVRQGEYPEAEEYYTKEKNLRIKLLSASDISFGRLYNNICNFYNKMARYSEALEVLEKALKINKAVDSKGVDMYLKLSTTT